MPPCVAGRDQNQAAAAAGAACRAAEAAMLCGDGLLYTVLFLRSFTRRASSPKTGSDRRIV